jgi:sugar lactone lactonase YvrE
MKTLSRMMLIGLFVSQFSFHCLAQIGMITTCADFGFPREGARAIDKSFYGPNSLAADGAGGFYFSCGWQNRIYHVASDGRLRLVVGNGDKGFNGDGGPATSARLDYPISLALDSADNLYVADANNDLIRKVTPSGTIMIIAGNGKGRMEFLFGRGSSIGDGGPATAASILAPHGVAMDSSGNLYILDSKGGRVRKVSWPSR